MATGKTKKAGAGFTYPKGETVWVRYLGRDGALKYIMTSKIGDRSTYYLYELDGTVFKKLSRGKNPAELEEKYVEL